MEEILNIGIVGAGGFAHFAAKAFLKTEGINILAVNDINENAAKEMGASLNARIYLDYKTLLDDEKIDLVYIATPPFLHYEQSKMALQAGKHVICEKPAALHIREAAELAKLSASVQHLYIVNLMQRYNPLYAVVKNIISEKLLGNFLHGFFENYASDENLNQDHWFWDESKSGGIFIEHGVHFFDMFSGWLGKGRVVNALQLERPGVERKIVDRVSSQVFYENGIVDFYHGFDQPKILDRQEMRLQFEHGEITLYEWVPVRMKLHGLLLKKQLERLNELLVNFSIIHHNHSQSKDQKVRGRFRDIVFDDHVTIEYESELGKEERYQQMLTTMIVDQWYWIKDHNHIRVIDETNAIESLRTAVEADVIAQNFIN